MIQGVGGFLLLREVQLMTIKRGDTILEWQSILKFSTFTKYLDIEPN